MGLTSRYTAEFVFFGVLSFGAATTFCDGTPVSHIPQTMHSNRRAATLQTIKKLGAVRRATCRKFTTGYVEFINLS